MSPCQFKDDCELIERLEHISPHLQKTYDGQYCSDACADCARHKVAIHLGCAAVPQSMLPTEIDRADRLLRQTWGQT